MKYAKKSLGQNFLVDLNIIKKIVNLINISGKDILEIGPGRGALTEEILKKEPRSLILVEKDNLLSKELTLKYQKNKKVKVYNKDILKFNFEEKLKKKSIIFGNLPYNISSQVLVNTIRFKKWPPNFSYLVFMFQKELAERITGEYGSSKYGRLSILSNYRLSAIDKFNISPNCFLPKPKVESTVLLLKPHNKNLNRIKSIKNLEKITNLLFSNKRKMINKNIKKIFKIDHKISKIKNLDLKSRPSDLKPEVYYEITQLFEKI